MRTHNAIDILEIKKNIYSGHADKVINITQFAPDMAIIEYDDRFWPPAKRMFGIAVKDGKAYGEGWQISSTVCYSYDEAILQALEEKHDGLNSQFSMFACRMLHLEKHYLVETDE